MVTDTRDQAAAFAGIVTGTMGGLPVSVPVLRIRHAEEWRKRLEAKAAEVGGELFEGLGGLVEMTTTMMEAVIDLVAAYDRESVLGGIDRIKDSAFDQEVWDLFKQMVDCSYPFVDDVNRMTFLLGKVTSGASTSSPSQSGDSTRLASLRR
jgi:hypothetical protein